MKAKLNIHQHGVEIRKEFLSSSIIDAIKSEIDSLEDILPKHGLRNADEKIESVRLLAESEEVRSLVQSILNGEVQMVRAILFDKTPDKNWLVTWHQDKTIAVKQKQDIDGWDPWSLKDGVYHVQPPESVLNYMVTLRFHLDDADENNGCLKVIPKSHEKGVLSQQQIDDLVKLNEPVLCQVKAGDLIIMRPHILHASTKSKEPKHRRVVHIEYIRKSELILFER